MMNFGQYTRCCVIPCPNAVLYRTVYPIFHHSLSEYSALSDSIPDFPLFLVRMQLSIGQYRRCSIIPCPNAVLYRTAYRIHLHFLSEFNSLLERNVFTLSRFFHTRSFLLRSMGPTYQRNFKRVIVLIRLNFPRAVMTSFIYT